MKKLTALDKNEIYRYLGYDALTHTLTPAVEELVEEGIAEILRAAEPRSICSPLLPLKREEDKLWAGGLPLEGKDIAAHLEHCTQAVLLAVTVGAEVDALIRRAQAADMAKAVALDAAANAAAEAAAQAAEEELRARLAPEGLYVTGRYSPGYGDLPIGIQRELLRLTDAPRKIGLSVTQNNIMTPRKSITAVMGAADIPVKGKLAGCGSCALREKCLFRKRGTTCAISN